MSSHLMYKSGEWASRDMLADVPTPEATRSWNPIGFKEYDDYLYRTIEELLGEGCIATAEYALARRSDRKDHSTATQMFSVYHITRGTPIAALLSVRGTPLTRV